MKIGFNKFQLFGKIIFVPIVLIIIIEFVIHYDRINFGNTNIGLHKIFILSIFSLVFLLLLLIIAEIVFFPIGLWIDKDEPSITLSFLFSENITVATAEIESYNTTHISTRGGYYDGVFINTKTGMKYIASDFNLSDYKIILAFLQQFGIPDNGPEKFRPFSYIIKYFL